MAVNPLNLSAILVDARWYGDDILTWENAPTSDETAALAQERADQLGRKPRQGLRPDAWQLGLAAQIGACQTGHRCGLGCCPNCTRATQLWLTSNIMGLAAQEPANSVGALSLIPPLPLVNILTADALRTNMEYVREKVESTGLVEWAVLCLDVSWNDYRAVAVAADWPDTEPTFGWKPHVYGFLKVTNIRAFKEAIGVLFPSSISVPVPVKRSPYDGTAYGASYAYKGRFQRRVSYLDDSGIQNAKTYRLPVALDIEAMRAMSELGLAGRIDVIGLKANGNSKSNKLNLVVENADQKETT